MSLSDLSWFPGRLASCRAPCCQLSIEELVDRYRLACHPVRDVFVGYLRERQPAVDYNTLAQLANVLAGTFWADLERHHPGIDTLHLPAEVATAWKRRLQTKTRTTTDPAGAQVEIISPRLAAKDHLHVVRTFYRDLAQWALEDPSRWAPWAVPCPISAAEADRTKRQRHRKARMDARTRERLPILPMLVQSVAEHHAAARARLETAAAAEFGQSFILGGTTYRRPIRWSRQRTQYVWAEDPATGNRWNLSIPERDAFWTWAAVEVLRRTGIRIEELLELTHHSLVQYRLPSTGEVVPLLQIAPSKTDTERLLLINPELADVLSAIICRLRDPAGAVPLTHSHDCHERTWKPPMPLLFQHARGGERRAFDASTINRMINSVVARAGVTGADGQPLRLTPHDFRRMFVTDAILNGLPPHIAQVICGHADINTTMGYKAVYPAEAIQAHRAFIACRRATRPSEEYRIPTDTEWEEFLGHFERRKVSTGTCDRAFGTPCIHEHACIRCSLLRPDPQQRPRLIEIRDNLAARIAEAGHEGWLGEVDTSQPRQRQRQNRPTRPTRRRQPRPTRLHPHRRPRRNSHPHATNHNTPHKQGPAAARRFGAPSMHQGPLS